MAAGLSRRWLTVAVSTPLLLAACSRHPNAPTPVNPASPATGSLHGVVRDAIPFPQGAGVPGVLVQVVYQSSAGPSAITADDGTYRIAGVLAAQTFQLKASREGYQPSARLVALDGDDTSADVLITPIVVTVQGVVTETAPADTTPVASAVVTILNGSLRGRAFTTDAAGAFTLNNVWGEFDISVERAGYERVISHVVAMSAGRVTVRLPPVPGRARATFTGELCTTEKLPPWLSCSAPFERTHVLETARPGSLAVTVNYEYVGDYYPNYLTIDVRCGSRLIAQKKLVKGFGIASPVMVLPDNVAGTFAVLVGDACAYDVRLWNFIADTKGGSQTKYRVDVEYSR